MSLRLKFTLGALAAGVSLLPAIAASADSRIALQAKAPVTLSACQVDYRNTLQGPYSYAPSSAATGVDIRFENRLSVDATEVDVAVDYGGATTTLIDKGRFSNSIPVAHTFAAFAGSPFGTATPERCNVVAVYYADGTAWHASAGLPIAQAAATHR